MNVQTSLFSTARARGLPASGRTAILAVGDGLVGPMAPRGAGAGAVARSFDPAHSLTWLRVIMPGLDLAEEDALGQPGETTTASAARLGDILARRRRPAAVIVSCGTADCLATMRGVAPRAEDSVAALESLAGQILATGAIPVFIVPPPSPFFANGLFADRFVAIAATLRRIARQDGRVALVDPTRALGLRGAHGIEPDPVHADPADGRLTETGAFRLAGCIAETLRSRLSWAAVHVADGLVKADAINPNPSLRGGEGTILSGASGTCASECRLDAHGTGGVRVEASVLPGGTQRLRLSGPCAPGGGFVRLFQDVTPDGLRALGKGDIIEASCDFDLRGPVRGIGALCLLATPVWATNFAGLHSQVHAGGPGIAEPRRGRLRTPVFRLPGHPARLHLSLSVHLSAGESRLVAGDLDIRSLMVRRVDPDEASASDARLPGRHP